MDDLFVIVGRDFLRFFHRHTVLLTSPGSGWRVARRATVRETEILIGVLEATVCDPSGRAPAPD
jgi:hypothetical protein